MQTMCVNAVSYSVVKLLGHGKGGYSYLVEKGSRRFVLKQIHHEPCDYYTFGNKIEAERRDYESLLKTGIRIPRMLGFDLARERVLKEYIEGPTIYELVKAGEMKASYLEQVRQMAGQALSAGLNIDYFPTNFVVREELLYYIDYECNPYDEKWNFENWGVKYWSQTPEFLAHDSQNPRLSRGLD